ncbi:MAG: cytochrome c3 family protein [SAR324 cluster bacterium]|nr:cytochrome c3 family protein [SAR324 cluster bacterium]
MGGGILTMILSVGIATSVSAQESQPINFSHKLHATNDNIPCQYCHSYARRSYSSGVPPVSVCVGCHGTNEMPLVRADKAQYPEADKARGYWARQEPIPWVKIHDVPDFVRFPHKKHINADANRFRDDADTACDMQKDDRSLACRVGYFKKGDDTRCVACHGDVKAMDVVQVVDADFGKMGWCLQCHLQVKGAKERKSALTTLGGWFNAKEEDIERAAKIGLKNPKGYHNPNLTDCYTCHY